MKVQQGGKVNCSYFTLESLKKEGWGVRLAHSKALPLCKEHITDVAAALEEEDEDETGFCDLSDKRERKEGVPHRWMHVNRSTNDKVN